MVEPTDWLMDWTRPCGVKGKRRVWGLRHWGDGEAVNAAGGREGIRIV